MQIQRLIAKTAEQATWDSSYFENYRHSMFEVLKHIHCSSSDLKEITNTLIPLTKKFPDFITHYVKGKDRFVKIA